MTFSRTDLSLLERMGDSRYRADAWTVFVDRYTQLFFRWFKHWRVDPHSMEDVLQESMIRVLGDIKSFQHQRNGSFRAWLKILARNSWQQLVEDSKRQLAQREVDPIRVRNWGVLSSKLAESHLVELFNSWATEEVLALALNRARLRTTPDVWETYERISLKNEPVAEVAKGMNIQAVQVYDRVSHIRKLIRQEMAEIEGPEHD